MTLRRSPLAPAIFLLTSLGCATVPTVVREAAAAHFFCPEEELRIEQTIGDHYKVEGCNQRAEYRCATNDGRLECAPDGPIVAPSGRVPAAATMFWISHTPPTASVGVAPPAAATAPKGCLLHRIRLLEVEAVECEARCTISASPTSNEPCDVSSPLRR